MPSLRHVLTYLTIAAALAALTIVQLVTNMPLLLGVPLVAAVSVGLLGITRSSLQIGRYFPELLKVPVIRELIGKPESEVERRVV